MIFIASFLLFLITLYIYGSKNFDYWKKRGIKHDRPLPFVGTKAKVFFFQKSMTQHLTDIYRRYPNEKVVGGFLSIQPVLIIRDPDIVKRILITDFSHFYLRRITRFDDAKEPLMRNLFNADGDVWRLLRQRLTPAFTSGKLKAMFPLIVERAEQMHVRIQASAGAPIDSKDLMARFATDFIGACGFGLEMDSLSNDNSKFRKLGIKIINYSFLDTIKLLLKQLPFNVFKRIRSSSRIEGDILSLVGSILKQRNYKPSGRNDFVDLLLQCKEQGTMIGDSIEKFKPDGTPEISTLEMTEDLMAAQMYAFFVAGFEAVSTNTGYSLHLLAFHPDIQKKVQDDIHQALAKYDNKLCYDAVKEMRYLEWAFKESMRLLPVGGFLIRECARTYKIPELNLTISPGVKIYIPNAAMQNDTKYFDNPEEFRPERFSPGELNVEQIKAVYLPFGDGPRACAAKRLGLMLSMAGLAAVLSKFTVEPAPTSVRYPEVVTRPTIIQSFRGGLPLLFRETKRE